MLDVSVVNVALPSMRTGLGLSEQGLQWVVNAYAIAFAGFMLLGGRAGDLYGRKRMFLVGLGVFTLASLVGGLAQDDWQLLVARAVQGLGAAVLAPSTLTILTASVPKGAARARAIGTWTAVGGGGGAAGGLVGGLLVEALSWRWVLLINVPVGAVVLCAAAWFLVEGRAGDGRRLDLPGALLVTAGLGTLAYGISQTEAEGWTAAATLLPLLAGLALLGAVPRGRGPHGEPADAARAAAPAVGGVGERLDVPVRLRDVLHVVLHDPVRAERPRLHARWRPVSPWCRAPWPSSSAPSSRPG